MIVALALHGLDEATGTLTLLEHSPSGAFSLSLDSFGRVIFTKWDHLQRDQQGDDSETAATYQAFTWASEAAAAPITTSIVGAEPFPEPRNPNDPAYSPALARHRFSHFFPWEMNEDGTAEETLNHVGRHELGGSYTDGSFVGDPNLTYYVPEHLHANRLKIRGDGGLFHLREDPTRPGDFLATYAPEFGTGSGGVLLRLTGAASINAESMVLTAVTPADDEAEVPEETGYFRNPLPMSDGSLVAVHTPATGQLVNQGSATAPSWSYAYRLKLLVPQGERMVAGPPLTSGIHKTVSWWMPDVLATYSGPLWELDPVEVVERRVPEPRRPELPAIEAQVFAEEGVDVDAFRAFLRDAGLALIVSRNVTQRDRADRQQPFNLRVAGGGVASIATGGQVYDVKYLQIFQADAVRGYGDPAHPSPGRRVLARPMHGPLVSQAAGAPPGAVPIAPDGSVAALVPARRALSWQLTSPSGEGVVRERNWLSFQAGEIRVCSSCHGINTLSQTGARPPTNPPQALRALLVAWRDGGGESGGEPPAPPVADPAQCAGTAIVKPRLRVMTGKSRITIDGRATIAKLWTRLAPATNGVRIVIDGMLDVTVPGGAGWTTNASGKRWLYRDPSGRHGGVRRLQVVDQSRVEDRRLALTVRIEPASPLPGPGAHDLTIGFGTADECATVRFRAAHEPRPRCAPSGVNLVCR